MKIFYPENIRFPMERANAIQIVNTCYALAKNGNKVFLIVRRMNKYSIKKCLDFYNLKPHPNLKIIRLPVFNIHQNFIWNYSYYLSLLTFFILRFLKPDIILTRNISFALMFSKFKNIFRYKVVLEVHTIDYLIRKEANKSMGEELNYNLETIKKIKRKEKMAFYNVHGIIAITNGIKKQLVNDFKVCEPIEVIPDGTNILNKTERTFKNKRKGIYYIGQLHPWKGVDNLIRAMQYIDKEILIIIGGLPYEKDLVRLKDLTIKLKLQNKIKFKGFLPPKKIKKYLLKAKIGVIPLATNIIASNFSSPLKLFEYMAAKMPIVASDLPSIREILTNGETAVLVKPDNPQALAKGINKLLQDESFAEKIVEKAYQKVQKYAWNIRAQTIIEFINRI